MYYLLYAFLYLFSLLPMRLLYLLSDGIYLLVYHVIGYRKEVVMNNLKLAFPEKTEAERIEVAKKFYHNFIDYFVEMIKLVSASDAFLQKRFTVDTAELNELYATGKACHLHLGHTFNWEWGQIILTALTKYRILVVYMPITNAVFEKLYYRLRTRSGNIFLPATDIRSAMTPWLEKQYLLALVADQNPSNPGNPGSSYWLNFFGYPTPFASGPEKRARAGALPVMFASIEKPRRGHYHARLKLGSLDASGLPEGELTLQYVRYLEGVIRLNPDMWLWSHRRWKHPWSPAYTDWWVDGKKE